MGLHWSEGKGPWKPRGKSRSNSMVQEPKMARLQDPKWHSQRSANLNGKLSRNEPKLAGLKDQRWKARRKEPAVVKDRWKSQELAENATPGDNIEGRTRLAESKTRHAFGQRRTRHNIDGAIFNIDFIIRSHVASSKLEIQRTTQETDGNTSSRRGAASVVQSQQPARSVPVERRGRMGRQARTHEKKAVYALSTNAGVLFVPEFCYALLYSMYCTVLTALWPDMHLVIFPVVYIYAIAMQFVYYAIDMSRCTFRCHAID